MINMLALCDALILACAYTAFSWWENAWVTLMKCGRWGDYSRNLAFVVQYGLGVLIIAMFLLITMNMVNHGKD